MDAEAARRAVARTLEDAIAAHRRACALDLGPVVRAAQAVDVAVGITTSGSSPNVVAGLRAARDRGLTTVALTGRDGGDAGAAADIHVNVPEASTARVQEVHRTLLHAICEVVEHD